MAQELISADKIILPHQQRVIDEEKELNDKVSKLNNFIASELFKAVDSKEQNLLYQQFNAMSTYHNILKQRINLWK